MSDYPPPSSTARQSHDWRRSPEEKRDSDDLSFDISLSGQSARPAAVSRPTILTVCTGNICRSPMAETLLRAQVEPLGIRVHSAGTRALVGKEMTGLAQELSIMHGATTDDVAAHRARWLVETVAEDADLVLAMTREHRTAAVELAPRLLRQTFTVREFARLSRTLSDHEVLTAADAAGDDARTRLSAVVRLVSGQRGLVTPASAQDDDVIDPYRREREVYEQSASQLVPAVSEVVRVLRAATH